MRLFDKEEKLLVLDKKKKRNKYGSNPEISRIFQQRKESHIKNVDLHPTRKLSHHKHTIPLTIIQINERKY